VLSEGESGDDVIVTATPPTRLPNESSAMTFTGAFVVSELVIGVSNSASTG
jgi:hypothetical protein